MSNMNMLTKHLDTVSAHIRLNDEERKQCRTICDKVEAEVTRRIRNSNSVISRLFQSSLHTGSYFNGVKIGKANEFDIDLVLNLPLDMNKYFINNTSPGFVSIKVDKAIEDRMKNKNWKNEDLKKLVNENGFLDETLLRREVESLLNHLFPQGTFTLNLPNVPQVTARLTKNGPAFTMEVECHEYYLDIDFVFVFTIPGNKVPPKPIRKKIISSPWLIVPKQSMMSRNWRISFPADEKAIIDSNYNLKPVYKLFKALRDAQKWNLASYHIKTLFLWKVDQVPSSYWRQSTGLIFSDMLNELMVHLSRGEIPFFWHSKHNMLDSFHQATTYNISRRCQEMLRKICMYVYDGNEGALATYVLQDMFRLWGFINDRPIQVAADNNSSCIIL